MNAKNWNRLVAGMIATVPIATILHAETYLTENQAATILFPNVRLSPEAVELTPRQARAIEKASGQRVTELKPRILRGPAGEALFVDRVLGKHDWISYAVAIDKDGKVRGVEILEYREVYGGEIRQADWRAQFVGKNAASPLRWNKDIRNISGATLSSRHVTDGIRRVLQTYELLNHPT